MIVMASLVKLYSRCDHQSCKISDTLLPVYANMGTTYKATIEIRCWKQHECVSCGSLYRYLFERKITGQGGNEISAEKNAEKQANKTIEKEVDFRPCPACGCLQPDMVAQQKRQRHSSVAWLFLLVAGIVLLLAALTGVTFMTYSTAAIIVFILAAVGLVVHVLAGLSEPNKNPDDNLTKAETMLDQGTMELVTKTDEDLADGAPKSVVPMALPLLALLALCTLALIAPFLGKIVFGWSSVAGTKPEVVGPGDTLTVYFPDRIDAVKSCWNGTGNAIITVDGEAKAFPMTVKSKTETWSNDMYVKKSQEHTSPSVWAEVQLPKDQDLVGKNITVQSNLTVTYPSMSAGNRFDNRTQQMSTTTKVKLNGNNAGGIYSTLFLVCVLAALGYVVLSFLLSAATNSLNKYASPSEIISITDRNKKKRRRGRDLSEDDEEEIEEDRKQKNDKPIRMVDDHNDTLDETPPRAKRRRRDEEDDEDDDRPRRRRRD